MKKIIYLLSVTFLMLQSCSTDSTDSSNDNDNPADVTVTDIEGNHYNTIRICDQTWLKSNLNVSHYRNGDQIPQVQDPAQWANLTTGAWCYYENNSANGTVYGKLYNWYAINDPRGLAPEGWHVPSDEEWTTLTTCLGGESLAGVKMKATTGWISNPEATNSSGFTGLPGGFRLSDATFGDIDHYGTWWSSTQYDGTNAWRRSINDVNGNVHRSYNPNRNGMAVRCIKN